MKGFSFKLLKFLYNLRSQQKDVNYNEEFSYEKNKKMKRDQEKEQSRIKEHFERFKRDLDESKNKLPPMQVCLTYLINNK